MKNLLVFYWASGKIKVEFMSAAEAIYLRSYSDVENVSISNHTDRVIKGL